MSVSQSQFREAVLSPDVTRPIGLSDGAGNPAGRRFDVYRNNVAVSLSEALETAFPVIAKLVGAENFKLLAAAYLRQHPPSSPLMMFYGKDMPGFLSSFEPTSGIQYLPDVARLELAMRESYHAADSKPIDPAFLSALPPEDLMATQLQLAPSLRLVRSVWPVHSIWAFNTETEAPKPQMAAEDTLVLRPEFDPSPILLPPGGGAFVAALANGTSLGEAFEAGLAEETTFDLGPVLGLLLANAAIAETGAT